MQREEIYQLFRNFDFEVADSQGGIFIYNPKLVQKVIKEFSSGISGNIDAKEAITKAHREHNDTRL